jgi:stage II sporulation protein GA (sporulation sigma-E factor processing peptidase)
MLFRKVVYIYPDIAFAVSFLMNTLILWGTARITRKDSGWARITAGACLGATYSFAAAFPQLVVLHSFWLKIVFSVVMFSVVCAPLPLKSFIASFVIFYGVSFFLGGFFVGILYFLKANSHYLNKEDFSGLVSEYFLPGIIVTSILYIITTRYVGGLLQKRLTQTFFRVLLRVLFDRWEVEVEALLDTGNGLRDPISQEPVVIIEYDVLKDMFPDEIKSAFEADAEPNLMRILDSLTDTSWATRFRIIPFTSLGKENGLLIGFRPDRIEVINGSSIVCTRNVIVGIYSKTLNSEGEYRALMHPDILGGMTA